MLLSNVVLRWVLVKKRENTMTSFVHLDYSNQHPGVVRLEAAVDTAITAAKSARQLKHRLFNTRTLATLLLSAIAAAVMVAAYQVMDSMADGHLLVLWIGMWAVAFATLAVCAGAAVQVVVGAKSSLDGWSRRIAAKRSDERLWAMARTDARVMTDLQAAMTRNETDDGKLTFVAPAIKATDSLASPHKRYGAAVPYF